ncbi:uncharacterized protein LOC133905733 [Phragmites australis]|uniref:uncharacterized protein LOC133905733 n=1 Tax=Phragmites australis TaxID=29695 RepID=UPI002D78C861|nr:uncharacterized protein LOC133905733 [Phragmites australis]
MNTVCEVCGDIGFKLLLLCCSDCNGAATHQYCLDKVVYDGSLADWLCDECQQKHGEVAYSRSLVKLSSERPSSHAHLGSTSQQPITKRVESARAVGPWEHPKSKSYMTISACLKKNYSSRMNSLQKKCIRKKSNMRGKSINRRGRDAASIACTSGEALHSCETIATETAKSNNGDNQQVDNESSVQTLNNDRGSNHLAPLDEFLVSDKVERQGGLTIASSQNTSSGNVHFTHYDPNKQYNSLKAKESPNPRSALEGNRTGQIDLQSNIRKLPFSVGKVAVSQVSGLKDNSGATLSSKRTDHDKQTNQHAPVGCKNMKVKSGNDNRTLVGAHQNKYWAVSSLRNKDKPEAHGDSNSNVLDGLVLEREKKEVSFQLDYKDSNELQQRSMAVNVPQPSILQNDDLDKAMSNPNMGVLSKEKNCLPSVHIENDNLKENQREPSKLLDQYSSSSLHISSTAKFALEASATEVENSDAAQNFAKENPRKRRRLILPYDDDDDDRDEEKAEDVQQENVNPRPLKFDGPMPKHRIDTKCYVEEAVQTGDLNDQNLMNGRPVKRRRYIIEIEDEDEEDTVGAAYAECALNDAANCSLNDDAKLASQNIVAKDHLLQSTTASDSESAGQQYYIYSQPLDEPIWSGIFKIDGEVFVKLDAHLSNKACQRVWELSGLLQPVVEVMKLPRLQAWPKRWTSSGPTDDSIGLFFFPRVSRANEVSNRVVNKIIKSDAALKVTVGIAELLIFPSVLLPEQYHFFQGKHYLWGVFKRKEDMPDKGVQSEEQDGSAHAAEEGELQEQDLLDQHDEVLYESSDQETFVVKHVVHVENQLLVERDPEAQKEAMKVATREGITSPGSNWSSAKTDSPKARSNCSVHPRIERKLHALGEVDQQEDASSLAVWTASSITEQSSCAVTTKLIKPCERGHGQPLSDSEHSTTKLFGFVVARTPRSQQLIQEMASEEGALLLPMLEEMVTADSSAGGSTGVASELNPEAECPHPRDCPQAFDFVSMGNGEPGVASEACLELFPVRQEQIGWAPRVEVSREVDLDLSLGKCSGAPSMPLF